MAECHKHSLSSLNNIIIVACTDESKSNSVHDTEGFLQRNSHLFTSFLLLFGYSLYSLLGAPVSNAVTNEQVALVVLVNLVDVNALNAYSEAVETPNLHFLFFSFRSPVLYGPIVSQVDLEVNRVL